MSKRNNKLFVIVVLSLCDFDYLRRQKVMNRIFKRRRGGQK